MKEKFKPILKNIMVLLTVYFIIHILVFIIFKRSISTEMHLVSLITAIASYTFFQLLSTEDNNK